MHALFASKSSPPPAWESEDDAIVDEIRLVLPAFAELRDAGDSELRELLAHDLAHDLRGQYAIGRPWLVKANGSGQRSSGPEVSRDNHVVAGATMSRAPDRMLVKR